MPKAEVLVWSRIRGRQILGFKFRRQYRIGPYVIDFYCPALKLAVELDGESHFEAGAEHYDKERQAFIERFGVRFMRFMNTDVYENLDGVLDALLRKSARAGKLNPPLPPLRKGGLNGYDFRFAALGK